MSKSDAVSFIILTGLWIVLCEKVSMVTVAQGLFISAGCLILTRSLLPKAESSNVSILKLILYFCYLIWEIYVAGFSTIKRIILKDINVDTVEIKTAITNDFLRTILANSITLTPGTISLDLKDDTITVLCLRCETKDPVDAGRIIKGNLENKLLKIQEGR